MVTIAHITTKLLSQRPFIQEALAKGIINYGGLAEELQPKIEKELGQGVKLPAVIMAIRRYEQKISESQRKIFPKISSSSFVIRSDLFTITTELTATIAALYPKLYSLASSQKDDFCTISQGITEVTIIAHAKYKKKILELLREEKIKYKAEDLAALTISIPKEALLTPGFFHLVTKSLAWENISIIEIISTHTELTCILQEKDIMKAFTTLREKSI